MKRLLSLCLTLCLLVPLATPLSKKKFNKLQEEQHKALHWIVQVKRDADGKIDEAGGCTANAVINDHTLLTAQHCDMGGDELYIDANYAQVKAGQAQRYTIMHKEFDNADHMLLSVTSAHTVHFAHFLPFNATTRVPQQKEHFYFFGNPHGYQDQFREGFILGVLHAKDIDEDMDVKDDVYLGSGPVVGGDSGSAVFSVVDGGIIGVVTYGIQEGQLIGMYALKFSQDQIDTVAKE